MESYKRTVFTLLFLLIILSAALIFLERREPEVTPEPTASSFIIRVETEYLNNGTEAWEMSEMDKAVSLFMNNSIQTVSLINHSHPIQSYKRDEDGNPYALLDLPSTTLKPGDSLKVTVEYKAVYKGRPSYNLTEPSGSLEDIPQELVHEYCKDCDNWQLSNPLLRELAMNLTSKEKDVLTIVENFVAWIRKNVHYTMNEYPLYPNETYTYRSGDCDDQAILFISLCRIVGIPAYLQTGCIYIRHKANLTLWNDHVRLILKNISWHGWAVAYIPPWGWLPVDLTWGLSSPLKAIDSAALITQKTFQLMNVTNQNYVASSREEYSLILQKNLYITESEEMTLISPEERDMGSSLYLMFSFLMVPEISKWDIPLIQVERRLSVSAKRVIL